MSKFAYKVCSVRTCDVSFMKCSYKHYTQFSSLYGAVYRQGNVRFTDDGNCVISPVGNRLSHFDLKKY